MFEGNTKFILLLVWIIMKNVMDVFRKGPWLR